MRPVYASRVEAWPPEAWPPEALDGGAETSDGGGGRPAAPVLDGAAVRTLVATRAAAWAAEVVARADPGAQVSGETVADVRIDDASGRWRVEGAAFDNAVGSAWRLAIEHLGPPLGGHPLSRSDEHPAAIEPAWRAELTGRAAGDSVVLTIRVASATGALPAAVSLPPTLIADLDRVVELGVGGEAAAMTPYTYDTADVGDLVDWLLAEERGLPIVLVSRRPDGGTAVEAVPLAARLATLAHVVELASFDAAFALTDSVGKLFSCFNGAVRVYWPNLSLTDDPYGHRLWLADDLANAHEAPDRLIADQLIALAAPRIGPDRTFAEIEAEERRRRRAALTPLRPPPTDTATDAGAPPSLAGPYGAAEGAVSAVAAGEVVAPDAAALAAPSPAVTSPAEAPATEAARADGPGEAAPDRYADSAALAAMYEEEIVRLQRRIDDLEEENQGLQKTLADMYSRSGDAGRPDEAPSEPARRTFDTVADAVAAAAEELAGDHLVFHPNVFDSAHDSDFERPNDIYAALRDIDSVARRYHDTDREGLKRGFKGAFEPLGQQYRDDISPTTRGHHGDAYSFIWKDERVIAGPHIGVGGPKPRVGWRIHWYVDKQDRVFVVWHVGRHLPWAGNA